MNADSEMDSRASQSIEAPGGEHRLMRLSSEGPILFAPDTSRNPTRPKPLAKKHVTWSKARISIFHPAMKSWEVPSLGLSHWLRDSEVLKERIPQLQHWLHVEEFHDLYKDDFAIHKYVPGKMLQVLTFSLRTLPGQETLRPFVRFHIVQALEDWEKFVACHNTDFTLDPDLIVFDLSDNLHMLNTPVTQLSL